MIPCVRGLLQRIRQRRAVDRRDHQDFLLLGDHVLDLVELGRDVVVGVLQVGVVALGLQHLDHVVAVGDPARGRLGRHRDADRRLVSRLARRLATANTPTATAAAIVINFMPSSSANCWPLVCARRPRRATCASWGRRTDRFRRRRTRTSQPAGTAITGCERLERDARRLRCAASLVALPALTSRLRCHRRLNRPSIAQDADIQAPALEADAYLIS